MPNPKLSLVADPQDMKRDEVGQILDVLRTLIEQAPTPVVKVSLEEAWKDIAHLAGTENEYRRQEEGQNDQAVAA